MKARFLFFGVLVLGAALSWSEVTGDLGATIKNSTGVESTGTAGLAQSDRVTAWLKVEGPRTTLLLRGLYSLSVSEGAFSHLVDVERLRMRGLAGLEHVDSAAHHSCLPEERGDEIAPVGSDVGHSQAFHVG